MNLLQRRTVLLGLAAIVAAASLSFDVGAAEKKEQTYAKKNFRNIAKSAVTIGDVPNHEVVQEVMVSDITYSNPDFKVKEEQIFVHSDYVDGSGTHRVYFFDFHEDGSLTYGYSEGTTKTTASADGAWESRWEGKYKYLGGTGKFAHIKGTGTYKGRMSSKSPDVFEEGKETVEY